MQQKLMGLKGKRDLSPMIVGEFNTPFFIIARTSRQKITYKRPENTVNQLDLIDIYTTVFPQTAESTLFFSAHRIFTKVGHILGGKTNLNKSQQNGDYTKCMLRP